MLISNMLYLAFPVAVLPSLACATNESPTAASAGMSAEKFADIKLKIEQHLPSCQSVAGKDITVILGNTGAGKSTMINFLAKTPMCVDTKGKLVPETGKERVKVRAGGQACTKFPEVVANTDIGYLCDLPGFQDTEGVVDDLLNAAFIRSVLTTARSVKALILTTEDELLATRGDAFKKLSRFMQMFKSQEFRNTSCYLLVNRVDPQIIADGTPDFLFENVFDQLSAEDRLFERLKSAGKVFYIPKTNASDRTRSLQNVTDKYAEMVQKILKIPGSAIQEKEMNMSCTLTAESRSDVKVFLEAVLKQYFQKMKTDVYIKEIERIKAEVAKKTVEGTASEIFEKQAGAYWAKFKASLKEMKEHQLLQPICPNEFREVTSSFEPTFYQEHNALVQTLLIEEQAEAKRIAEEEAKRKGEEAAAAEKRASEKEEQAIAADRLREAAEIEAQKKSEEAEQAKQNLHLSEAEKLRFAEEAKKAEAAREKAAAEAKEAREAANKALEDSREQIALYDRQMKDIEKKSAEMQQMYTGRLTAMERDLQERRAEAEREKAELRHALSELKANQQEERETLQRQLQESQAQNTRALKEAEERFQKEKESWKQSQQSSGGGRFCLVPTPHGWVLVRVG